MFFSKASSPPTSRVASSICFRDRLFELLRSLLIRPDILLVVDTRAHLHDQTRVSLVEPIVLVRRVVEAAKFSVKLGHQGVERPVRFRVSLDHLLRGTGD